MLTLIVRQSLKNGTAKTWKLRSGEATHTFGSSRLANVISISPTTRGIQGLFEYRDGAWWYVNMDSTTSAQGTTPPSLRLDKEQSLELPDCTLHFMPVLKEADLFLHLENSRNESVPKGRNVQLFIVKQNKKVVETKVLPINQKFRPSHALMPVSIACVPTQEWHRQNVGDLEVSQRTISVENAAHLGRISPDQLVDEESKKGVAIVLGAAALIALISMFSPPSNHMEVAVAPPKVAQKIIVKTDLKPKKKRAEQPKPQQVVVKEAPAAPKNKKVEMPTGGNKVASMMKSISGGRISQLIGKVSAQAAKSGNVIVANGTKAGTGASGRALAAVGKMERSGRDWGTEGTGNGVRISTAGRGGGGNASSMGGLAAGSTGSGGVGLIEEESEVIGGLDREIIAQYIKSQLGQILYCYERQLSASPELFGKVAIRFTIGSSGSVEAQKIGDTTLKNATVEGCILNRVAAWKFPAPQGGTKVLVTYPFLFKSTN
ncbi:hypothetical protein D3C87_445670 [compost metagenome]